MVDQPEETVTEMRVGEWMLGRDRDGATPTIEVTVTATGGTTTRICEVEAAVGEYALVRRGETD